MKSDFKHASQIIKKNLQVVSVNELLQKKFASGSSAKPKKCFEVIFGRDRACPGCGVAKVWETKKPFSFDYQPFAELPTFKIRLAPNFDQNGKMVSVSESVVLAEREILEKMQKDLHEKLIEQQGRSIEFFLHQQDEIGENAQKSRKMRHFLDLLAHQMQQPILVLQGYVNNLIADPSPKNEEILKSELQDLRRLVEKLLHLAKFDHADFEGEKVEIVDFCERVFGEFLQKHGDISGDLQAKISTPLVGEVNQMEFEQLLWILLENGAKYGTGRVRATIKSEPSSVRVCIWNSGSGIKAADREKIFEPFFQKDAKKSGFGLGLAMAKKIAERHRAKLFYDPKKVGAEFVIQIPKVKKTASRRNKTRLK